MNGTWGLGHGVGHGDWDTGQQHFLDVTHKFKFI